MSRRTHQRRIIGLETEYGCLAPAGVSPREVVEAVRDWIFRGHRFGLIDRHDRGWDEPAGNGGFLFNGGRLYVDMGHIEFCTPECATLADLVRYDRAGDLLLQMALRELGLDGQVGFIRNNVDHYTGATFGCHENYSMSRMAPLNERNVLSLLTFLTLRVLLSGSGRVGAARGPREMDEPLRRDPAPDFQISQRADFIENDFYQWVQHNRAIINTRDEPLADPWHFRRLHLIHGDTNVLPGSLFLKAGTTRLMLDLLERDELPDIELRDAVASVRHISRTLAPPWRVVLSDGAAADALDTLGRFRRAALDRLGGRDAETDTILEVWGRTEEALATDLDSLFGVVDWLTKYRILSAFSEREGLSWHDPWLEAQDLEYHHCDAGHSLGLAVCAAGPWSPTEDAVRDAMTGAPQNTRAGLRSRLMRELSAAKIDYRIDWESMTLPSGAPAVFADPFSTEL